MSHIIRIKRSNEPGAVPAKLAYGELAFNFADRVLYIGDQNGNPIQVSSAEVVEIPTEMIDPVPPSQQPGYTSSGIRRRVLPFEN